RDLRTWAGRDRQSAGERRLEQPRNHQSRRRPIRRKIFGEYAQGTRPGEGTAESESQEQNKGQGQGEGQMNLRFWGRQQRVPVVDLQRANPVRAGVILIVIILIAVYF